MMRGKPTVTAGLVLFLFCSSAVMFGVGGSLVKLNHWSQIERQHDLRFNNWRCGSLGGPGFLDDGPQVHQNRQPIRGPPRGPLARGEREGLFRLANSSNPRSISLKIS